MRVVSSPLIKWEGDVGVGVGVVVVVGWGLRVVGARGKRDGFHLGLHQ